MNLLERIRHDTPPDFRLAVNLGYINGWSEEFRYGRNADVDSAAAEDVILAGGTTVLKTSAAVASVVSTDTDDDGSPADTGARTVTVEGLDANLESVAETVTLNGTGAVVTTQTYLRITRAYVVTAGSSGANEGTITVSVDSSVQATIPPLENDSRLGAAVYHTAADEQFIITDLFLQPGEVATTETQSWRLEVSQAGGLWLPELKIETGFSESFKKEAVGIVIPASSDMRIKVIASDDSTASAYFRGYSVDSSVL